jgi:hypothetical protein
MKQLLQHITREHIGAAFMGVGFVSLVAGVAVAVSPAYAAIVGGGLMLLAGIVIDRMG